MGGRDESVAVIHKDNKSAKLSELKINEKNLKTINSQIPRTPNILKKHKNIKTAKFSETPDEYRNYQQINK